MTSRLQKIGRFLSGMMMPNISAFVAWGIITTLFSKEGWLPNSTFDPLISMLMYYALPSLVAYAGGRTIYNSRGGIIAVISTMGIIAATDSPMFVGAMIMGPFSAWCLKKADAFLKQHTLIGFEMLTMNFSAGFMGSILILGGYLVAGPIITAFNALFSLGVDFVVERGMLFLAALFIEPGKILFLNNAINHGLLTPLGLQETLAKGYAIFFLLETNPGPGIGVLVAYWLYGKGVSKHTAPSALIIHALGGIHEIYFPYVLMNPSLFIAVICGGLVGNFMFQLMDCGLVAMASPGSLFAIIALAPKQRLLQILIGIILSAITSFLISGIFLSRKKDWEEEMDEEGHRDNESLFKDYRGNYNIKKIVFACDAGMGSSAMGASLLGKLFYDRGLQVKIDNVSIEDLPEDADVIVTYKNLVNRTRKKCPLALHVGINDFLDRGYYDHVVEALISQCEIKEDSMDTMKPTAILMKKNIILNKAPVSKSEAIVYAGELLVESGYVEAPYIEGMLAREEKFTTFIGKGVAIPHGENAVKDKILASGIVVVQYPGGVDFGEGNIANLVIGIAGKGNEHLEILANIAEAIEEDELLNKMITTTSVDEIYAIFAAEGLLEA